MSAYSLYDILGVAPDATTDEIARAYRRVVKNLHPDVSGTPATSALFGMVQNARDVLTDPIRRAAYDRERTGEGSRSSDRAGAGSNSTPSGGPDPSSASSTDRPGRVKASSFAEALAAFQSAMATSRRLDPAALAAAIAELKYQWTLGKVSLGSIEAISEVLRSNLQRDVSRPGFDYFTVERLSGSLSVEVRSQFRESTATRMYRIWGGTGESAALMGSAPDTIVSRPTSASDPASGGAAPQRHFGYALAACIAAILGFSGLLILLLAVPLRPPVTPIPAPPSAPPPPVNVTGKYDSALTGVGRTITVAAPRATVTATGDTEMCSSVTYKNTGSTPETTGAALGIDNEWVFRGPGPSNPEGDVSPIEISDQVQAGSSASGLICASSPEVTNAWALDYVYNGAETDIHSLTWCPRAEQAAEQVSGCISVRR